MMTRVLLAVAVLSSLSLASSRPVAHTPDTSPPVSVMAWSPETGRRATIAAELRQSTYQYLTGQTVTAYEALVPFSLLASLVDQKQARDANGTCRVTIWMYYDAFNSGGYTWVSIRRYETMWELLAADSTVRLTNARMNAGCAGDLAWPGSQHCDVGKAQQRWIGTPQLRTRYSLTPSWAGNYIAIYDISYQAGNSRVELRRGPTTRWFLDVCIFQGYCAQMGW